MGDKGKGSQEVNTKEFYFTLFSLPSPIPFLLLALKWEVPTSLERLHLAPLPKSNTKVWQHPLPYKPWHTFSVGEEKANTSLIEVCCSRGKCTFTYSWHGALPAHTPWNKQHSNTKRMGNSVSSWKIKGYWSVQVVSHTEIHQGSRWFFCWKSIT